MIDNDMAAEHRLAAMQRAQDEVLRLEGECERLRRDAARYRWLRDQWDGGPPAWWVMEPLRYGGQEMDAAMKEPA